MLLELSVIPLGRGRSISADIADVVKIIDASDLDYRLTAAGTILEGGWEQLIAGVSEVWSNTRRLGSIEERQREFRESAKKDLRLPNVLMTLLLLTWPELAKPRDSGRDRLATADRQCRHFPELEVD